VRRCGEPPEDVAQMTLGPCHAHVDGFDLHAGLVTRAGQRDRLERLCRHALRPPLAQDRLHVNAEGTIWLTLGHRWADGTTTCASHVEPSVEADEDASRVKPSRAGASQWAELMRRTFGLDVLACPRCGGAAAPRGPG
jgi:hypothetical protein